MTSNLEGNKGNSTTGDVPPEVNVTGNVPMILSPIPASQVESASSSATVSISGVNVEKYIIKDIAKKHLGLALMELLGVVLERAAEQGKPPEEANASFPLIPTTLIIPSSSVGTMPPSSGHHWSASPRGRGPACSQLPRMRGLQRH